MIKNARYFHSKKVFKPGKFSVQKILEGFYKAVNSLDSFSYSDF